MAGRRWDQQKKEARVSRRRLSHLPDRPMGNTRVRNVCALSRGARESGENTLVSDSGLWHKAFVVVVIKLIPLLGLEAMPPSPPPRARLSARLKPDLQEPRGGKLPVPWSRYSAKVSVFGSSFCGSWEGAAWAAGQGWLHGARLSGAVACSGGGEHEVEAEESVLGPKGPALRTGE